MFKFSPTPGGSCVDANPSEGSSFGSARTGVGGFCGAEAAGACATEPYPEILMRA